MRPALPVVAGVVFAVGTTHLGAFVRRDDDHAVLAQPPLRHDAKVASLGRGELSAGDGLRFAGGDRYEVFARVVVSDASALEVALGHSSPDRFAVGVQVFSKVQMPTNSSASAATSVTLPMIARMFRCS